MIALYYQLDECRRERKNVAVCISETTFAVRSGGPINIQRGFREPCGLFTAHVFAVTPNFYHYRYQNLLDKVQHKRSANCALIGNHGVAFVFAAPKMASTGEPDCTL